MYIGLAMCFMSHNRPTHSNPLHDLQTHAPGTCALAASSLALASDSGLPSLSVARSNPSFSATSSCIVARRQGRARLMVVFWYVSSVVPSSCCARPLMSSSVRSIMSE